MPCPTSSPFLCKSWSVATQYSIKSRVHRSLVVSMDPARVMFVIIIRTRTELATEAAASPGRLDRGFLAVFAE